MHFTFYDTRHVGPRLLVPDRGGAVGSTLVTVHGSGFLDLGGVHCRFGDMLSAGTLLDGSTVLCRSPPFVPMSSDAEVIAGASGNASDLAAGALRNITLQQVSNELDVRVVLNNDSDTVEGSAAGPAARFRFTAEPCGGEVLLTATSGAFHDGLLGTEQYTAQRNCTWRLGPTASDAGPLLLMLTHVRLSLGLDMLTIHDGEGELLRALPLPGGADQNNDTYGCGLAAGTCLETIVVRRPPALVRFLAGARAEEAGGDTLRQGMERHVTAPTTFTTARLTALYFALGNSSTAESMGRSRPLAHAHGESNGLGPSHDASPLASRDPALRAQPLA